MYKYLYSICLILLITFSSTPSVANSWNIDFEKSTIEFTGVHAGNDFKGIFKNWQADIQFDPKNAITSYAEVRIFTGSATTGNALYDGTIKGEDWFDIKSFPEAVFKSVSFTAQSSTLFEVVGALEIKGKSVPLKFPVSIEMTGNTALATFEIPLNRLWFDLGVQSDPTAVWVAEEIGVKVRVVANR